MSSFLLISTGMIIITVICIGIVFGNIGWLRAIIYIFATVLIIGLLLFVSLWLETKIMPKVEDTENTKITLLNPPNVNAVPSHYNLVELAGYDGVNVYFFIDDNGETQYRAYAQQIAGEDTQRGFVEAMLIVDFEENRFVIEPAPEAQFIDVSTEVFDEITLENFEEMPDDYFWQSEVDGYYVKSSGAVTLVKNNVCVITISYIKKADGKIEQGICSIIVDRNHPIWPTGEIGKVFQEEYMLINKGEKKVIEETKAKGLDTKIKTCPYCSQVCDCCSDHCKHKKDEHKGRKTHKEAM